MLKVVVLLMLAVTLASCTLMTHSTVEGVIDGNVILPCRLQGTMQWYVMQWKRGDTNIFTLTPQQVNFNLGENETLFYEVVSTLNSTYVQFDLKKKGLRCNDAGLYSCVVVGSTNLNSTTNLTITAPTKKPHPGNQMEILKENVSIPLECEADVGYPHGFIYWYKKEPGDKAFTQIEIQPSQKLTNLGDCKWNASSVLDVVISRQQSGTVYKCAVQMSPGSSYMDDKSADIILTIIDENTTTVAAIVVLCEDGDCIIEKEEKDPNRSTTHGCSYLLLAITLLFFKAFVLRF